MADSNQSIKKQRCATAQEPAAHGSASSSTDRTQDDTKKKYSTPGAGSKSRRKDARANQEVKNIQRFQEGMPIPTGPLQQQIKWEKQLHAANTMAAQNEAQVAAEARCWRESLAVAPPGASVLPSYIPPTSTFIACGVVNDPGVPLCPRPDQQAAGVPPCPRPDQQAAGVPLCPRPKWAASVPLTPGVTMGQLLAQVPTMGTPKTAPLFRGSFQGVKMYGCGSHIGTAVAAFPTSGGKGIGKSEK